MNLEVAFLVFHVVCRESVPLVKWRDMRMRMGVRIDLAHGSYALDCWELLAP